MLRTASAKKQYKCLAMQMHRSKFNAKQCKCFLIQILGMQMLANGNPDKY